MDTFSKEICWRNCSNSIFGENCNCSNFPNIEFTFIAEKRYVKDV